MTSFDGRQQEKLALLSSLIAKKFVQFRFAIAARRDGGIESAQQAVNTDVGKKTMDRIREVTAAMRDIEGDLLVQRKAVANASYKSGMKTSVLSTIFSLVMVTAVLFLIQRNRLQASRANLQLHVEKENLRVTLSSIGDAVIATDLKGRITSLNPIAESLTGWTNEEARGE